MIKVRPVETKDWKGINELFNANRPLDIFSTPRKEMNNKDAKDYVKKLTKQGINLVAVDNYKVVALIELIPVTNYKCEHTCYGNQLNVLKGYRRQGIAKKLFKEAIKLAKKKKVKLIFLYVVGTNKPAMNLYKKLGFTNTGKVIKYYKYGNKYVDNCIFCKWL